MMVASLTHTIAEGQDGGWVVVDREGWCVSEFDHVDYADAEAELEFMIQDDLKAAAQEEGSVLGELSVR